MKQVIVIHGGTTYRNYDDYLTGLKTKTVHVDRMIFKPKWKERLQNEIGGDYQVLLPSMPNPTNARYEEWKIWVDRIAEVTENGCVLVGHSLGAVFLAKYLSENVFPRTIAATILIAAPYDDESIEDLADFKLESIAPLFTEQAGAVTFFFGTDDPVIAPREAEQYKSQLPYATYVFGPAPDHFVRESFPELTEAIRKV